MNAKSDRAGQPKIKLYQDESGNPKGDGLVTFFKPESVHLCINLLDDTEFRYGQSFRIRVQEPVFTEKEKDQNQSATSKKVDKRKLERAKQRLEKKLEWFEESTQKSGKIPKVVVLKHMFTLEELEEDPTLLLDLKQEVWEECEKLGSVTSVALYDVCFIIKT